jgi:penicillin-binding protein 2
MIDGKRTKLKDNSMFVCFAPRENPQIAIAVVVENAGFGSTWASPIASLLLEKYLNDTLRAERLKEVERIAETNLMPDWLQREQFKQDSIRAFYWFERTNDTSIIRKYLKRYQLPKPQPAKLPATKVAFYNPSPVSNPKNYTKTKQLTASA